MATIFLTAGDDNRTIVNPGTYTIDGLGGSDTLSFGTSLRSSYTITKAQDGAIKVDSISGASGAFHATLYNTEILLFDNGRDKLDVAAAFGSAPVTLQGTAGNDSFMPASNVTAIDGGAGIDTVALSQASSACRLETSGSGFSLSATDGSQKLALSHVERLQYSDERLALDLDGHAGQVARILGAVFGAPAVHNRDYAGIGLQLSDAGMSYEGLMQLALDARLGPGASSTAVVTLLYGNVVGAVPPAADLAYYVGLLDSHAYNPATLGVLAADTALNSGNIDLTGLASIGLAYVQPA